jgi:chaperonin GroEL
MPHPEVLIGANATADLVRGFNLIAEVAARTLGPSQGAILSQSATGKPPEALTDAATIARRIFALPDRAEDVGAMLARNLIWRMQVRTGDGAATAAVLAQALLREGVRYSAAGGNVMAFRSGVSRAVAATAAALRTSAKPIRGTQPLERLSEAITAEPGMSAHLAAIFEEIGPDAFVRVEKFAAPYLAHEFQAGAIWSGRLASPYLVTDQAAQTAELADCDVALFDGDVTTLEQIGPLLELVLTSPDRGLLLVANEVAGAALTTVVANQRPDGKRIAVVELQRAASQRTSDFRDLAVFTSAAVLSPQTGRSLQDITLGDLGRAIRVIAGKENLVTMCGEERAEALADQVQLLRDRVRALPEGDEAIGELRMRAARLSGQTATLRIGAHTEAQRGVLQAKAEKAVRSLPLALRDGVVPGGGAAYVHSIPALDRLQVQGEESAGVRAVSHALTSPFLRIAANAGISAPAVLLDEVQRLGPPHGYDVLSQSVTNVDGAGIVDPVAVLVAALETAASGAMLALSVGAIVLRSNPETTYEP